MSGVLCDQVFFVCLVFFVTRCSNRQRLAYADEVLEDIVDSAEKPMTVSIL